ncbi:MAG TPA: hypothetical protein VM430_13425 [Microbacterium sp.]|nr:hypothetical protein [Microbacterium sp.]
MRQLDSARRQLAMPIVAVEDGGVVPVASVHETPASVEALKRDLRRALAEHDEARAQCSRLNRELDDARDERDRWKNAYENAAETKRAAISSLIAERDAWKQQANDDAERFVRAAERAGSEQRRVDEIAAELETALRQRDAAHGVIANLRAVLANVVGTLDDLDPNAGQENKS